MSTTSSENSLLAIPFEIPFPLFRAKQIETAIAQLIADADQRIASLETATTSPTYASFVAALESATEELELASTIISHLESVSSTPEWRAALSCVRNKSIIRRNQQLPQSSPYYRTQTRAF